MAAADHIIFTLENQYSIDFFDFLLNRSHFGMLPFRPDGNAERTARKAPLRGLLGARELLRNSL
ncbi:MAG: hypothetical protein HQL95_16695 [Magnetococcales bacterium]|nr:hypothetical protein [Magnetococcales bacterium]